MSEIAFLPHVIAESQPRSPDSTYSADLDGDGDMDVLSASSGDDKVAWYENTDGKGSFGQQRVITNEADGATSVHAVDVDADGDVDVLSASRWDHKIAWYENTDGKGNFGPQQVITTEAKSARSVYAADVDGDADLDVLSASGSDNKIAWYENTDGKGSFGRQRVITTGARWARSVYAADMDGDGDTDALSASQSDGKIAWYENTDGKGSFGAQQVITTKAEGAQSVFAVDVDADGDVDVFSAAENELAWYENTDAKGTFGQQRVITTALDQANSVYATDLDGDGDMDVLSASWGDDTIAWYENTDGKGSFGPQRVITNEADGASSVHAADVDADGNVDVLSASDRDDKIAWYENVDGKAGFGLVIVDTELDVVDSGDGVTSLREAILAANTVRGPDEIIFDFGHDGPATILLDQGELEITDQLTITGDAPDLLTIDAQHQSRIFNITAAGGDFALAGMTLTGGKTTRNNADLYEDNTFSGGAIRSLTSGNLTISNSDIRGNASDGEWTGGGGVFAAGDLTINSSTVLDNSADMFGGGISGRTVTVTASTISGNWTYNGYAGGIHGETITVTSSTISGNSARGGFLGFGSAIVGQDVTVTSSTISGNSTFDFGAISGHNVTVASSTISGNSTYRGGGIHAIDNVTVTSSTISENSAKDEGGGIWVSMDCQVTIKGSIVAGNTASGTASDLHPGTGTLSVEHSLIGTNVNTSLTEAPVGSPDANGNLIGGPTGGLIDSMLGPLADNGGLTFTHTLLPGSPAIGAGDPLAVPGIGDVAEFDQRGVPYTRVTGGRIDMGAHEWHSLAAEILNVASPIITPVREAIIQFSGPVTGLDLGDLELSLNGGENLLTDSQNLSTTDNQTFVLGGLTELTTGSGLYTLTLVSQGSGIVDANGDSLDVGDRMRWAMGRSVLKLTVDTLVDESDGSIDDGDVSLRDAIAAAAPGETIDFDPSLGAGTILLTLGELSVTRPLTIDAIALASGLVIDAAGNDPTSGVDDGRGSRVFDIDDGNTSRDSPVTIRGVTLTGGDVSGDGGAIHSREKLTVASSTISGNSAAWRGGGILGGDVSVTSSVISGNSAGGSYTSSGGGIEADNVTVTSSTISGNSTAWHGGGIRGGHVTVDSSTISDNSGGGISGSDVTVNSSTISGNSTESSGGGIRGGHVTVDSSTISGNSGGGISGSDVTVNSSTISGNSTESSGGGIGAWGNVTITSSTISGNSAETDGGGIWASDSASVTMESSIVARNTAGGTASELHLGTGTLSIEHNLIGANIGTSLTEAPVGSPDANGNLIGGRVHGLIDPLVGPLADNGGLTWTHSLLPGSPAIDAGDPSMLAGVDSAPLDDQRGEGFDRVVGGRIDLGAFEVQIVEVQVLAAGDANGDRQFDQRDIVQVLQGGKYNTGEPASWSEGDWTADGVFDQEDIVAALATGNYLQGSYALREVDATFATIRG